MERLQDVARRVGGLYERIAQSDPKLRRGLVWCRVCGAQRKVDSAECLRNGWPICCGATMGLDGPGDK